MATTYGYKGDFIGGKFVAAKSKDESWSTMSPADLSETVFECFADYNNIDDAVDSARVAYKSWASLPIDARKEYLWKLKEVYSENKSKIATAISRETGKPKWETLGEAQAMINKIDITINHSLKLVETEVVENALPKINGVIRYKPRGVQVVVGPFNFPGHLPNGHIVPALITGNTVIFKPSEKTAYMGQLIAEMIKQAGFPPGVFNLVQGRGETGKRLVGHQGVDGVLFTGSYDVGLKIKQATMQQYWKLLALEMGGKNTAIVWDDADLEKAVYENLVGSFISAGQRCACTSRLVLHKSISEKFIKNFHNSAKKLTIGHWSEDPFMGPVIDEGAVEKCIRFQDIALREGAECIMGGKALERPRKGHYVSPSIYRVEKGDPQSIYQSCEIFGPNVCIYEVDDFDEALDIVNMSGYGLAASIFTKQKSLYEKATLEARTGILNWNRTTNGASSKLPFGGMGKSGNDRPSAHFAVNYCTVPVASLEDETDFNPGAVMPGVNYEFEK